MKKYPCYKPTSSPWIGEVPEHWTVERLKQNVTDVNEQARERLPNDIYIALENVEGWTGKITGTENETGFDSQVKKFQVGDVLFGKLRPYLAKVTAPERKGICVGEFLVLRSQQDSIAPDYLEQLLRSKGVIDTVDASTFGAKMPRADWNFIASMLFPIPPLAEQAAIVRYLDEADQRIRTYMSAKERLIALLEEERQAVIHQAVTQGLDPNVRLKPSGVEWLGNVPEHWVTLRIGHFSEVGNGSTPSRGNAAYWTDGVHPWLNSSSVNQDIITEADQFVTDLALRECHLPSLGSGNVLVGITGEGRTRGTSAVLDIDATINQHVAFIALKTTRVSPYFLHMCLTAAYSELRAISSASGSNGV